MTVPAKSRQDRTISNTTVTLILLVLILIGINAVLYNQFRGFKEVVYKRCVQSKPSATLNQEFRQAQVEAFTLITKSPRIDNETRSLYQGLADKAKKAVDSYRPVDCGIYK